MMVEKNIDRLPSGRYRLRLQIAGEPFCETFETLEEAVEVRDALLRKIADGERVPTHGETLEDVEKAFLASRLKHRSYDTDESRWFQHVHGSAIATIPMRVVETADAQSWLDDLAAKMVAYDPETHGERVVKPLSRSTRQACLNLARRAFAFALKREKVTRNPLLGLRLGDSPSGADVDDDEGYQEGWYLDPKDQIRLRRLWLKVWDGNEKRKSELLLAECAFTIGFREGEQWCLHLSDVRVTGSSPHVKIRYGSWDGSRGRFLSPKGRRTREVPLWGPSLEAMRAWLKVLPTYAEENPGGLVFPTERGCRRDKKAPRGFGKVAEAFGINDRIGRRIWWHLMRHTCASSLVAGWWGRRWALQEVQQMMGHKNIKTTERYAHLAPSAVADIAAEAHSTWNALSRPIRAAGGDRPILWLPKPSVGDSSSPERAAENKAVQRSSAIDRDSRVTTLVALLRAIADEQITVADTGSPELLGTLVDTLERMLDEELAALSPDAAEVRR